MPPGRNQCRHLAAWNPPGVGQDVFLGEIQVRAGGNQQRPGPDPRQGPLQVAPVDGIVTHIRLQPGFDHRQQVGGIPPQKPRLPIAQQKIVERRVPSPPPQLVPIERLRQGPPGVDPGKRPQPRQWSPGEPLTRPVRVGLQGTSQPFQEDAIVRCGSRCRADRHHPLHPLGMPHRPVQGLLAPHRPSVHEGQLLNSQFVHHQPVLSRQVVGVGERRPQGPREWLGQIAGRRRQPIPEHVAGDHEVPRGVEDLPRTNQPLHIGMLGPIRRGIQHRIAALSVQHSMGLVDQPGLGQRDPPLQHKQRQFQLAPLGRGGGHFEAPSPVVNLSAVANDASTSRWAAM